MLSGRANANVTPLPSALFCTQIFPPWASIILFDMNKPKPVPVTDFVANFANNLGIISGSIPVPVSAFSHHYPTFTAFEPHLGHAYSPCSYPQLIQ